MRDIHSDAVILTGAGISASAGLPDGQQLARRAFRAVTEPVALPDGCRRAITTALSAVERARRRLQHVARADPTRTHAAIVATGLASVTANQDELLEASASAAGIGTSATVPAVLHVHGIASVPSTS